MGDNVILKHAFASDKSLLARQPNNGHLKETEFELLAARSLVHYLAKMKQIQTKHYFWMSGVWSVRSDNLSLIHKYQTVAASERHGPAHAFRPIRQFPA